METWQLPNLSCFNTQPRGGGCMKRVVDPITGEWFQHTAARRRLHRQWCLCCHCLTVSTHSRAKAAARLKDFYQSWLKVSTHSRAKAAAKELGFKVRDEYVSTHSRAKAAAQITVYIFVTVEFQHTAARRRLHPICQKQICHIRFQHTAARRRLHC